MIQIGKYNNLTVVKMLDFGVYLDGEQEGEILLPIKQVPSGTAIGDVIKVFIYHDSEDRIIATTIKPYAQVGDFALLKTVAVSNVGAFLDWGLIKDLLVPFSEQKKKMEVGRSYLVHVYLDYASKRIAATAKLDKYLDNTPPDFKPNEEVDLMIWKKTDLGYTAIVNRTHQGMLFHNEVFQTLKVGQRLKGFVKRVREDDKIDLYLHKAGYDQIDELSQIIVDALQKNEAYLPLTDKSSPELIYETLAMSKKNFKKSVGNLYKNKIIDIENDGIRLL